MKPIRPLTPKKQKWLGMSNIVLGILLCFLTLNRPYGWLLKTLLILLNAAFFLNWVVYAFLNTKLSDKQRQNCFIFAYILAVIINLLLMFMPRNG